MTNTTRPVVSMKYLRGPGFAPQFATGGSAAIDVKAAIEVPIMLQPGAPAILIPTGFALDFSSHPDLVGLLVPRSGMGHKEGFELGNTVGVIDSDYHGEIMVSCIARGPLPVRIEPHQRIAQLLLVPVVRALFGVVSEFKEETARGTGGFGSTGKL